jgi:hypothetical protein
MGKRKDCPLKSYSMPNKAEDAADLEVRTAKNIGAVRHAAGNIQRRKGW